MDHKKERLSNSKQKDEMEQKTTIKRRTLLKSLLGLPVLGLFGLELAQKWTYDHEKKSRIIKDLGLDNLKTYSTVNSPVEGSKGDLLRIGVIGFGTRGSQHVKGLGYMRPEEAESRKKNHTLEDWLAQEDLGIAVTGICDVFDLHAENGLATYRDGIRAGGAKSTLPVKRYRTYQEMLDDKDIDAVMIVTPDHHHATIAIAAAKAGKHIYCEKSVALSEEHLHELYDTVKKSKVVYQLGHQIPQSVIFKQAREILEKNTLGKITLIETTSNRNTAEGAWIRDRDNEGEMKPGDEKTIDWNQWLGGAPKVPFSLDRYYNWTKFFDYDIGMLGQLFTHE